MSKTNLTRAKLTATNLKNSKLRRIKVKKARLVNAAISGSRVIGKPRGKPKVVKNLEANDVTAGPRVQKLLNKWQEN